MNETELIKALSHRLRLKTGGRLGRRVQIGIGDDAAIGRLGWVACTDMLVEDVDFRWSWASAADVGHKAAAINLSDLAAMGACPEALLVAVAAPQDHDPQKLLDVVGYAHRQGCRYNAPVVGGDISSTRGPWVISVTALGRQIAPPLQRHRAQLGDIIAVSRPLGAAAAGLRVLEGPVSSQPRPAWQKALVEAQLRPVPQVQLGQALAHAQVVRSAADISDGLSKDVLSLLGRGQRAHLVPQAVPIARGVNKVAQPQAPSVRRRGVGDLDLGVEALKMAVCGGEDFALVTAISPHHWHRAQRIARRCKTRLWAVGRVQSGQGVAWWRAPAMTLPGAFDHFS